VNRNPAGVTAYQRGFLLHYLDKFVYPDIPPALLSGAAVVVVIANLGIYALRLRRAKAAGKRN